MSVYETVHYRVDVGPSSHGEAKGDVYRLINKKHGVVEIEASALPDVLDYADHFESTLEARLGKVDDACIN